MLIRRVVADEQQRRRRQHLAHARRGVRVSEKRVYERWVVGRAVVVDVIGAQHQARKLLQKIIFLIGGSVGADHADGRAAVAVARFAKPSSHQP